MVFKDALGVITKTIQYTYDVNDRRIEKKIDGITTERYVLDRDRISLVFDGAGVQTHRYLYGTGVDEILADETPTGMVWVLADRLGSVRDLIDSSGIAVSHINYDSYGRVITQAGSVEFRYGYTGRETDGETGLDYYRARYYDASNGRFISEDPLGFGAGDSNLTRYVGNNAVNYVDPSGLGALLIDNRDGGSRTQGYSNQPMFGGGSGSSVGGLSTGNGFGVNTLRGSGGSSGSVGGGNFRPTTTQPIYNTPNYRAPGGSIVPSYPSTGRVPSSFVKPPFTEDQNIVFEDKRATVTSALSKLRIRADRIKQISKLGNPRGVRWRKNIWSD